MNKQCYINFRCIFIFFSRSFIPQIERYSGSQEICFLRADIRDFCSLQAVYIVIFTIRDSLDYLCIKKRFF